ncbi:DUF6193 family natural product biosynthesis protein [Nocardia tengchongensis]|uniref:DUF6193 family natural product biosynthesis protein n=1 Tax=Nocardia tengchongensis TaxID=2055889 RepID=UPI003622A581
MTQTVATGTITLVDSDSAHSPTEPSAGGNSVAAQWDLLRNDETYYRRFLDHDLVEAVYAHPQLGVLFPFTSVTVLHLSRCTRYPFSFDVPCVVPDFTGTFKVMRTHNMVTGPKMIGVGVTAAEAVTLIAAHLPEGCGPAIDGTAEDLR